jgi:CubicO group peptidase (beta-lactamase class C family)
MYENIKEEAKKIIEEGWTDGIAVLWGTNKECHSIYSGTISGTDFKPVSENTVYDLASVTKIFFLICILKLVEKGTLSLNACVGDYSALFPNISGLKIYELMNFSKPLQTTRRIDTANNYEEAVSLLHNVQFVDESPKYSDMGAIILSLILNELLGASFREVLSEIKEICNLSNTFFWDEFTLEYASRTQSYDKEYVFKDNKLITKNTPIGIPHDPKARILGACGHAGIFSTPKDITSFCQCLLSERIITKDTISLVSSPKYDTYVDEQHFGLLCYKKSTNQKKSEIPALFSDASFAISGFTGTYLLIDPEKNHFISINSNRIYNRCTSTEHTEADLICTKNYVYRKDALINQIISNEYC